MNSEVTRGSAVKLVGSTRKWRVVADEGAYLLVAHGSGFETVKKRVRRKDATLWRRKGATA